jgi:hypothetical protein
MKKALAKRKNGSICPRTVFPKTNIESYAEKRQKALNIPADRITVRQAADLIGVTKGRVRALIRDGKLTPLPNQLIFAGGMRKGDLLSRSEVERHAGRRLSDPAPFVDCDGKKWLTEKMAEQIYAHAKGYMLRRYRNKPCPQMPNAAVLRARELPEEYPPTIICILGGIWMMT